MTASIFDGFGRDNPLLMSAAGLCKTFDLNVIEPLAAAADFVVVGSITLEERGGNEGVCEYFDNPLYSVNAWGMPNPGARGQPGYLLWDIPKAEACMKKVIISLAEFSPSGYYTLFSKTWSWGAAAIELNFGCPNVRDDGTQHKIVSFDPATMYAILDLIGGFGPVCPIGVKLSPYSDPGLLKEVAGVIASAMRSQSVHMVDYVAVTNTFPNGRAYTAARKPALATKQASANGGIGGEAMKPISLSNAAQFREALPVEIGVIRVGGISTGDDVWQSYDIGARGVQVATAVAKQGPGLFTAMRQQYADIVG